MMEFDEVIKFKKYFTGNPTEDEINTTVNRLAFNKAIAESMQGYLNVVTVSKHCDVCTKQEKEDCYVTLHVDKLARAINISGTCKKI